jgi:hypothetical protein
MGRRTYSFKEEESGRQGEAGGGGVMLNELDWFANRFSDPVRLTHGEESISHDLIGDLLVFAAVDPGNPPRVTAFRVGEVIHFVRRIDLLEGGMEDNFDEYFYEREELAAV